MQAALLPHLIRKDLRHFRILLGLWLLLVAAQSALTGIGLVIEPGNESWQSSYTALVFGVAALQGLATVILVPLLIHSEPLVGTTAFWLTRPISRGTLLAAKGAFILCFFILLPLTAQAAIFLANGITPGDTAKAAAEILFRSLVSLMPILAIAAITRSFASYAFWLVMFYAVTVVAVFALVIGLAIWFPKATESTFLPPSLAHSRTIVTGLCYAAGGLFVVVWQYLRRRTFQSIVALVAATLTAMTIQILWPVDFFGTREWTTDLELPKDSVLPSIDGNLYLEQSLGEMNTRKPESSLGAQISFANLPAGCEVSQIFLHEGTLTLPDRAPMPLEPASWSYAGTDWWPEAMSSAIGGSTILNAFAKNELYIRFMKINPGVILPEKTPSAQLKARLQLTVQKISVIAKLPLKAGAMAGSGSRRFEIGEVRNPPDGCRILVRERSIDLWRPKILLFTVPDGDRNVRYVLVNRTLGEALLPDQFQSSSPNFNLLETSPRFVNRTFVLRFSSARGGTPIIAVTDEWLAGAELAILESSAADHIERELTAKDFLILPR